ncbi:MAG: IS110 family transposase [Burkholderiales bacterium]|nr:IS110 family transposase [Burkholderiales bacterium]MDR4517407.1 IS110 family transposase [Nitrosomonas sp.]
MTIARTGVDLAKQVFQIHGVDGAGKVQVRKQLRRSQMLGYFSKLPPCLIGMEACGSAHYWARELSKLGHEIRLMAPQFVKPYVKSGKNDANDAEAICEAVGRPNMRFVAVKTVEQQVVQAGHRIRARLIKSRTALTNEIRGLLGEFGIVVATSIGRLRKALPELLEDGENGLPGNFRVLLAGLSEELRALDDRIAAYDTRIVQAAREDEQIKRLLEVEGIGPVTASALVAAVGNGTQFNSGRDMAAWFGLTPRQHSSGGKNRLGRISKRGDKYIRMLLVHGARAALNAAKNKEDVRSRWAKSLAERRNKNARIAWSILSRGEPYRKAA